MKRQITPEDLPNLHTLKFCFEHESKSAPTFLISTTAIKSRLQLLFAHGEEILIRNADGSSGSSGKWQVFIDAPDPVKKVPLNRGDLPPEPFWVCFEGSDSKWAVTEVNSLGLRVQEFFYSFQSLFDGSRGWLSARWTLDQRLPFSECIPFSKSA